MTDATRARVNRILLDGAREAYLGPEPELGVPVDRRCPACGITRDGCDQAACVRRELSTEKE